MPKIIIDGQEVECRDGIPVLQAALEAGREIPYYCYHPGLKVVASCRLCLMEMKLPHPKTHELDWAPKLFPSCQTPVKDGLEVRFNSAAVQANQRHVMEYYLLNHPLDCPVCDKAGECYLQDYTEEHGPASSRMVEDKTKNPKKDIGPLTLLYQDRCVLCTRCVRFAAEVAGTSELAVVNRGSRNEIDVFPGHPLDNPLQGNVVDLCPVGALLDKDFLFKQRVWLLKETKSVSPVDSQGQTVWVDHNDGRVWRVRPRFNERVNEWWISDEARFYHQEFAQEQRLHAPLLRNDAGLSATRWEDLPGLLRRHFQEAGSKAALVLSPMMSCEEAWLLTQFARACNPAATLVLGHVPVVGEDQHFPKGFVIKAEKCPNRRGVDTILKHAGGKTLDYQQFLRGAAEGAFSSAYVVGGYRAGWLDDAASKALGRIAFLAVHDLFPSPVAQQAQVVIPGAAWYEREGSYLNCDGLLQVFERAVPPLEGVKADGQFYAELNGEAGLFRAAAVRERMAAQMPEFGEVFTPRPLPEHAH